MAGSSTLEQSLRPSRAQVHLREVTEFLLVGGLTPLLLVLGWLLRGAVGMDAADLAFGFTTFHAAFVLNDPHFAVTYLLFYRDARARAFGSAFSRGQRIRYLLAGLAAPVVLAAWSVAALSTRSAPALGRLNELMFLLVGWHYVKQGFGVLVILAARRGVRFDARERAALLAHAYAGWAYAWANPAQPAKEVEEKGVVYVALSHPSLLEHVALLALLVSTALLLWVLVAKWRRERGLRILTPLTAFLCSIWSWSIFSSADPLLVYAVPALHSLQYLYFVQQMRGAEAREREGPPWFERSARVRLGVLAASAVGLGWLLLHGAPAFLDGALGRRAAHEPMSMLGATPFLAAMTAFVNIHHYLMDAVIWRRENQETRYLLRD
jgi:hypothetical protein